jgi:hypothetical protein
LPSWCKFDMRFISGNENWQNFDLCFDRVLVFLFKMDGFYTFLKIMKWKVFEVLDCFFVMSLDVLCWCVVKIHENWYWMRDLYSANPALCCVPILCRALRDSNPQPSACRTSSPLYQLCYAGDRIKCYVSKKLIWT